MGGVIAHLQHVSDVAPDPLTINNLPIRINKIDFDWKPFEAPRNDSHKFGLHNHIALNNRPNLKLERKHTVETSGFPDIDPKHFKRCCTRRCTILAGDCRNRTKFPTYNLTDI